MKKNKNQYGSWIFVGAIIVIPITVFSFVNWYQKQYHKLPVLFESNVRTASFALTNQHGKLVTNNDVESKIQVVDFFFTHCPSICPKMTSNLKMVQEAFYNDSSVLINSFSIDPERDSSERLAIYAEQFKIKVGGWNLLTGSKKEIYRLARKGFYVTATDGDGGPDDFIHSEKLVLVDSKGRIRGYYDGTDPSVIPVLIKDMIRLKKESD